MRGLVTLLCLASLSTTAFAAEAPPARDLAELRARIAVVLQRNHVPGAGLALVTRDRLMFAGGVGWADRASKQPVTSETLFRVGSITKSFIALALLQLAERGRIDLNARVADLAPELAIANRWQKDAPITVAHLLEHTAGFDDMHFNEMYAPVAVEDMPLAQILARNPASRVARWRPGSRFSYANPGYTVAAYLIEKVSGRPWRDYVRDEL
ncbi:MAG TPA: serine hydrolase domain-containing protein, partial [Polyangia bacterium]|nr:serine hydrolase domain-containing protein [Polyangia bacterium]